MFSFFKKTPKTCDECNLDLAIMLFNYPEDPVINSEFFTSIDMDFSLDSLKYIDEFLEGLRNNLPEDEVLMKLTLRCGSYIGEVIRREAMEKYNWLEYKEAIKINDSIEAWGVNLGTSFVLWSSPDRFIFPLAKVLKKLGNGNEDGIHFFADVAISGAMYN